MQSTAEKKNPRKPLSEENKEGKFDSRNKLNDLTGKEWLLSTTSFWKSENIPDDRDAYAHPAPFLIKDVERLIKMFTKKGMTVLDPFVGSGTTIIASNNLGRKAIGIDINSKYKKIAEKRLKKKKHTKYQYIIADATKKIKNVPSIDYVVTSPPYHNILKNNGGGIRKHNGKLFRMGAREGVEYYSDKKNDLGNFETYQDFIFALSNVMKQVFVKLKSKKYCTVIMSDFTVNKQEKCVQADVVPMMEKIGFEFCGTVILLQNVKPLFPFGYPYAYKINHQHHNIMTFKKSQ